MKRSALIDRKQQVIAEASRLRRDLEMLRGRRSQRVARRQIARLERRIEQLAAEEARLRLLIDRSPR